MIKIKENISSVFRKKQFVLKAGGVIVIASFFVFFFFAEAGTEHNVTGWLWSGTEDDVLNNNDGTICDKDFDGVIEPGLGECQSGAIDGNETSLGWVSMNNTSGGGAVSYGVSIPDTDGPVTGFAWSEHYGWIQFDPVGPYPAAPGYSARRTGNALEGWARILSIATDASVGNSGGWEGWIKLSGSGYGVVINSNNTLGGYGWNGEKAGIGSNMAEGLGWIDFSRAKIAITNSAPSVAAHPDSGTVFPNSIANLSCTVSDPDGDPLTYAWTKISGPAVTISGSDQCSASFVTGNTVGQKYEFKLTVTDGNGGIASDQADFTVIDLPCVPDCSDNSSVCQGKTFSDGCGGQCIGAKDCLWKEIRP